jgi:TRAP transporter 4TM/12TM fusion protein
VHELHRTPSPLAIEGTNLNVTSEPGTLNRTPNVNTNGEARTGKSERLTSVLGFALAVYALYWAVAYVETHLYRISFLLLVLLITFLSRDFNGEGGSKRTRPTMAVDAGLIALSLIALLWPLVDLDGFVHRAATPMTTDIVLGIIAIAVILEATRRTSGWVLPITALAFLAYGYYGALLDRVGLDLIAHRGYSIGRLIGTLYMTLEGIFGVPLDVAATYIILFTIYGAILEYSGAGHFFVDWTMAAIGRSGDGAGPGRTVTVAGYLLGAVSGSGVANTVMLGSITWPLMRRAGYPADIGGAVLASAGIGAILAPPVMGAAAFLIAEFLRISYLQVITMAAIPALLYYLSIFLMVEGDSRRLALRPVNDGLPTLGALTRKGWHYFASLAAIVVFMVLGFTPYLAVFWATVMGVALSFVNRETALWPQRLATALAAGGRGVLPVAATTATAGIIVGVITLTGLGLKVAGLIVTLAGSSLLLTIVYAALAVWVLGLAVPVTASYIIAAVMIVPALVQVGVAEVAAHMFVFYYAVLSEVSPPTALSPFAAAALTGASPLRTTMLSWKYTAPAFIVPFAFTFDPRGLGLLLHAPAGTVAWSVVTASLGVVAIAVSAAGWIRRAASPLERTLAAIAAALLFVPSVAVALTGAVLLAVIVAVHWLRA